MSPPRSGPRRKPERDDPCITCPEESEVNDTEANQMDEHVRGLGYLERRSPPQARRLVFTGRVRVAHDSSDPSGSSNRRRAELSRGRTRRQPIAPRGDGNETTKVGAVDFHAPERAHADPAVLRPGEEDPITLGREVDDLEPVRPV